MNRCSTRGFKGSETILYDTIMGTCHYTFVKTIGCIPKVNHNVKHGLSVKNVSINVGSLIETNVLPWYRRLIVTEVYVEAKRVKEFSVLSA